MPKFKKLSLAKQAFQAIDDNDSAKLKSLLHRCPQDICIHLFTIAQPKKDSIIFNTFQQHFTQTFTPDEDDISMEDLEKAFEHLGISERINDNSNNITPHN